MRIRSELILDPNWELDDPAAHEPKWVWRALLDGHFSADELEQIAKWMRELEAQSPKPNRR